MVKSTVSVDVIHKNKHEEVSSNSNQRYLKIEIRDPEKKVHKVMLKLIHLNDGQ